MGGSSGGGNQTTRIEPPKYQLPYLERGLGYAQEEYSRGQPVVPFSNETETALGNISSRAMAGTPINNSAQTLATNTLNGGFLGSNPYLDQTFNRAALATQNQLASQFAGSGRNIEASEGNRAQQLNDLATQIYGGNYEAERGRQQQTLGMAPMLDEASYSGLDRLLGVGAAREGLAQEQADAPGLNLDRYLGRVQGNMGQTSYQPTYRNRAAGALGGAQLGGQFGSSLGSYMGGNSDMYGAFGGLLGGYLGGWA